MHRRAAPGGCGAIAARPNHRPARLLRGERLAPRRCHTAFEVSHPDYPLRARRQAPAIRAGDEARPQSPRNGGRTGSGPANPGTGPVQDRGRVARPACSRLEGRAMGRPMDPAPRATGPRQPRDERVARFLGRWPSRVQRRSSAATACLREMDPERTARDAANAISVALNSQDRALAARHPRTAPRLVGVRRHRP